MPKVKIIFCSVFLDKIDRSTQSSDPEALDGQNSETLGTFPPPIFGGLDHFRQFFEIAVLIFDEIETLIYKALGGAAVFGSASP